MHTYLAALKDVLDNGTDRPNRTGIATRSKFGLHMSFDLQKGFPAVTTKKLAFGAVVAELIGFIRGYDNAAQFRELGCKVWDQNAQAWSNSDDLGRIYGVQWRKWKTDIPLLKDPWGKDGPYIIDGYRTFDQLTDVIERIKRTPFDRRLIVSAWNPWDIHEERMALPPCHVMFQFYVRPLATHEPRDMDVSNPPKGYLDLAMYQRSADMFLGVPFNIASYSLLLEMVAQVTGYLPGRFEHFIADAHIYHNHFDQVQEQLARTPFDLPSLSLNPDVKTIDDFAPSDVGLNAYECWPTIKAEMAV